MREIRIVFLFFLFSFVLHSMLAYIWASERLFHIDPPFWKPYELRYHDLYISDTV